MADTKRLLETVEYDTIPVGTVSEQDTTQEDEDEILEKLRGKKYFSDDEKELIDDIPSFHSLGGEEPKTYRSRRVKATFDSSKRGFLPSEEEYDGFYSIEDEEDVVEAVIDEVISKPGTFFMQTVDESKKTIYKTAEIETLESILSQEYGREIEINKISKIPMTRKQVKEVYFSSDDWISKVWIFKAEPELTSRELAIYHVANELEIPTGKPIGFNVAEDGMSYPFDIAILGGIVEHAGEPYDELISNLTRTPHKAFKTALAISEMIADYHVKLTQAFNEGEFAKYDVDIERASPRREIKERLLSAFWLRESQGKRLVAACEELYDKFCCGQQVVSHGDLHTGNLVTLISKKWNIPTTSLKEFGVIDWGSLAFDHPYGDLTSFWLHHQRHASGIFGDYDYIVDNLIDAYQKQFNKSGKQFDLSLNMKNTIQKSLVQSTLWNIYELFDPTRNNRRDARAKAASHAKLLRNDLKDLEQIGCKKQAHQIRKEIYRLLDKQNVYNISLIL